MKSEQNMIVYPNAKINLGLKVLSKRPDGFHDIETLFYPVGLCDILEVIEAADGIFSFQSSGLGIPGDPHDNLCVKAFNLIQRDVDIPPVNIHLHKIIPMGAGLGGGSSDGAFMIRILNDFFSLGFAEEKMAGYATLLGSDCTFFLRDHAAFGQGKGDMLSQADIDLSVYRIVIVVPNVHVNTREAYKWLDSREKEHNGEGKHHALFANAELSVNLWKHELVNDFELPVFSRHPELFKIKELLYSKGAVYASMTGSGAAVYGLFNDELNDLSGFEDDFVWIGEGKKKASRE